MAPVPNVCIPQRRRKWPISVMRGSSVDQDFNGQIDKLKAAGCNKVFSEKMSGKSTNGRPLAS